MNFSYLLGIVIAIFGIVFGATLKVKNKKIEDLERANKIARTEILHNEYENKILKQEKNVSKATVEFVQQVAEAKKTEPLVEKPDEKQIEKSTKLSEEEQKIARKLSIDPFAD